MTAPVDGITHSGIVDHIFVGEFGIGVDVTVEFCRTLVGIELGVAAVFVFHHYEVHHMERTFESRVGRGVEYFDAEYVLGPEVAHVLLRGRKIVDECGDSFP